MDKHSNIGVRFDIYSRKKSSKNSKIPRNKPGEPDIPYQRSWKLKLETKKLDSKKLESKELDSNELESKK